MKKLLVALGAILLAGCGDLDVEKQKGDENQLSKREMLDKVLSEALEYSRLQKRSINGKNLYFKPNYEQPYTGWVIKMHPGNSQVEILGSFQNGQKHGNWLEFYSFIKTFNFLRPKFDRKSLSANYDEGKEHGLYQKWFANGQKSESGYYKMGGKNGEWTQWYQSKTIAFQGNFKEGKAIGSHLFWWKNGQPQKSHKYSMGVADGTWWEAFENGQKTFEGNYLNGAKNGVWTYWYENGQKRSKGGFLNDKKNGEWVDWDKQGKQIKIITYKDDEAAD